MKTWTLVQKALGFPDSNSRTQKQVWEPCWAQGPVRQHVSPAHEVSLCLPQDRSPRGEEGCTVLASLPGTPFSPGSPYDTEQNISELCCIGTLQITRLSLKQTFSPKSRSSRDSDQWPSRGYAPTGFYAHLRPTGTQEAREPWAAVFSSGSLLALQRESRALILQGQVPDRKSVV